jgi:hypothetical protein
MVFLGCHHKNKLSETEAGGETTYVTNDTVPEIRVIVSKKPVADYTIPINNPLLQQYFGVRIYETRHTFQYLLKMQYEGMIETDTLKIPNFGTWPAVVVKPGKEKLSCIIGFLDKGRNFKEYKLLTAKGNNLKLKTLHHYFVGGYRTKY